MANIKFSQLPVTTSFTGATVPVVQGGSNFQVTANTIQNYILGSGTGLSVTGNISGGNVSVTGNVQSQNITTITTNITSLQGQVTSLTGAVYTNANVAAYLPTNTANITANSVSATGTVYLGQQYVEKTTSQTFANPYTPNIANGTIQSFTATSNFALNAPTGMTAGQNICLIITQDATGSRVMTPNAVYKFAGGIKTLSIAPNAIDSLSIFYTGSTYLCTIIKGYA